MSGIFLVGTIEYGEWQSDLKQANWPAVVEDCTSLLITRSKDLRLSVWLTEGLVKTSGLAGLGEGMDVAVRLIERFGGQIHPQPEGNDQESASAISPGWSCAWRNWCARFRLRNPKWASSV